MGESVLVLLCDGDRTLYSVLTDCYCSAEHNHLASLMANHQVKQIDAFIWTHPDQDHSKGIENTLNCFDKDHKAEIFIPEGLIREKEQESCCAEAACALDFLYRHYSPKSSSKVNRHIHIVGTDDHEIRDLLTLDIVADDFREPLKCKFRFVLPNTSDCLQADFWDQKIQHNLMSIVYSIELNGRNYIFTGDLMDGGTLRMNDLILSRVKYIKIPHHGSDQSMAFLNLLRRYKLTGLTASATRFNNSQDPKPDILRAYRNMGEVYYITDDRTHPAGCIETVVKVINDICTTNCHGNAMHFA